MTDRLIDKYAKRAAGAEGTSEASEADGTENLGCFGWLRGVRDRAIMLELRKKDGRVLAVGYSWVERMLFDPDDGITLWLPGRRIRIIGSGLNTGTESRVRLFAGIVRHRVPWIQEDIAHYSLANSDKGASIERIDWEDA